MKKYVIEREIPKIGTLTPQQVHEAAAKSNSVLAGLGADIQWQESPLPFSPSVFFWKLLGCLCGHVNVR